MKSQQTSKTNPYRMRSEIYNTLYIIICKLINYMVLTIFIV